MLPNSWWGRQANSIPDLDLHRPFDLLCNLGRNCFEDLVQAFLEDSEPHLQSSRLLRRWSLQDDKWLEEFPVELDCTILCAVLFFGAAEEARRRETSPSTVHVLHLGDASCLVDFLSVWPIFDLISMAWFGLFEMLLQRAGSSLPDDVRPPSPQSCDNLPQMLLDLEATPASHWEALSRPQPLPDELARRHVEKQFQVTRTGVCRVDLAVQELLAASRKEELRWIPGHLLMVGGHLYTCERSTLLQSDLAALWALVLLVGRRCENCKPVKPLDCFPEPPKRT
ncbi:unnamed protein product [Polarella glacialis]|uniref:Uncharacterized protein n=1 Tax=Polarella glacialis TaxID=89957 RepID=A0A813F8Z2_POLGL|nr:unnamed protein product [Polarella glacialis]